MKNKLTVLLFLVCANVSFAHSDVTFKFTENKGQLNSKVLYHNKLHLGDMFLERDRFTFNMYDPTQLDDLYNKRHGAAKLSETDLDPTDPKINQRGEYSPSGEVMRMHAYSMIFQGANEYPKISASDELPGYTNYSIGKNARKWASMVKSYRMVQYQDLYPGIDMEIYTALKNMKYDFIVAPGANPNDIVIEYDGVESISLLTNGDLLVKLSNGEVKEMSPTSYQEINGQRIEIDSKFKLTGNQLSFEFPSGYDNSKELIIDPVWIFSTLSGSTADNWGFTATYDSQGNLYAAGIAFGTGYPTTLGAESTTFVGGNFDIAISKFDPTGANLLYSTYVGGTDNEMPHSMVTNSSDQLVLLGSTGSANFPTTTGAYNEVFNGGWAGTAANMWGYNYASGCDISITTFDNSGSIINSTFVGGTDNEGLNEAMVYNYADQGRGELVLDDAGNVYVATSLYSSDFPVTDGSIVNGGAGFGFQDAVVFKMNSNLSALNWATYLGGTGSDAGYSVRIAPSGTVYVSGGTTSTDIGADPGSLNPSFGGIWDGYIASFNGATGAHLNKTYIGTSEYDQAFILETDSDGDVYVTGQTLGTYPVFNAAYSDASSAQFIHKLSSDLTTSIYSTVFGSSNLIHGGAASCDVTLTLNDSYGDGWNGCDLEVYINGVLYATYTLPLGFSGSVIIPVNNGDVVSTNFIVPSGPPAYPDETSFNFTAANGFVLGAGDYDVNSNVMAPFTVACTELTSGRVNIAPTAFLVDNCENVYVSGWGGGFNGASSTGAYNPYAGGSTMGMTVTGDAQQSTTDGSDFYFFVMEQDAAGILYGTYFGDNGTSEHTDGGTSRFDPNGVVYQSVCAACGGSFPTTPGSYATTSGTAGTPYGCNLGAIKFEFDFQGVVNTATSPGDQTLCGSPYNVDFTGGSSPQHEWDFGDGNTSTAANPTHTYADSGTYQVMYVAIDPMLTCGPRDTVYFNINLIIPETFAAVINVPPYDPCTAPDSLLVELQFTGSGADSISWDMGDGTVYTDSLSISHYYMTEATYYIEMIAYDFQCNLTDTIRDTVRYVSGYTSVTATAPPDQFFCSGPFNVSFSGDVVPDHYWDFGDASGTSTSQNPTYTYADTGTYTVMYVAIDSSTCNIADTAYFTVQLDQAETFSATIDVPPIDPCNAPDSLLVDLEFTGSGADSLYWNMGDGTTYINDTAVAHYYDTMGTYYIEMIAFDFACNNIDTILDTVEYYADFTTVAATAPPDQFFCSGPFNVSFSGDVVPDHYWDFGDGTGSSTSQNPMYTYADTGTYTVMYVAIDSSTCNIADTAYFTVQLDQAETFSATIDVPPIDPCNAPDSLLVDLEFTGSGADSLYWNMGDGTTYINDTAVAHYYDTMGTYYIEMIAFDFACNNIDTILDTVEYYADFTTVAATAPPDQFFCSGPFNVSFSGDVVPDHYWDFGDGTGSSTSQNPMYTYADTGTYTVMYVAIDSSTCNIADTAYFTVQLDQAETFSATIDVPPIDPCNAPDSLLVELEFTGSGADSLYWNMGDGTTYINDTAVAHYYDTMGTYYIEMIAFDFVCNYIDTILDTVEYYADFTTSTAVPPPPQFLCDPPFIVNFDAGTAPPPNAYWDFGDGVGTSTGINPSYTYADTGTYNVLYVAIDSSTCNIADSVYFTVELALTQIFDAELTVPPIDPCNAPDSLLVEFEFTGTGADSLYWNMGDGTIYINDSLVNHYYDTMGTYYVEMIAFDFVCNRIDTIIDTVEYYANFTTVSATAPPNQMICSAPFDVSFAGDTTPNHYWDFGDGIGTSTAANPMYTYADSGNYTVMYVAIDSSTCNISDTVYFSVDLNLEPALTAVFDLPTVEPCTSPDSLEVTLTFTGAPGAADSLFWDLGDGTTFIDSTTVSHFYTNQGVYVITMEAWDFTCGTYATITDTVDFTVTFSTAIAEASPNILACDPPFDVVFDGGTPPPPMSFWDFDDGTTSTLANPPHTFVDTGHYDIMYVAIDSSTCNIADTIWLTVDILQAEEFSATLDFDPPPPCGTDSIVVNLAFTGTGADSLSWDFGDGTVIENSTVVSHVYHDAGIYTISLYAEDTTCNKTEIVNNVLYFYGNPNSAVIVPNVFTPNQDGKNDFILFSGVDPNVEFTWTIFNRWGKPIFETVRPGQAWDGTNMLNGKQLEAGLYYYELIYRDQCQNEDKLVTGFIHLMR